MLPRAVEFALRSCSVENVGCPILYCTAEQVEVLLTSGASGAVLTGGPGDRLWDEGVEIGILKLVEVGT